MPLEDEADIYAQRLVNAGPLPHQYPQRFYRYALLDPVDKPFATFRYYYRTIGMTWSSHLCWYS